MSAGNTERIVMRFIAAVIIVASTIIALVAGLCTWIFGSDGAVISGGGGPMLLLFGGVPFLVGVGGIIGGVALWRGVGRKDPPA